MQESLLKVRLTQSLMLVGPFTTLIVNPFGNYDPISVVKMGALTTFAFLSLALGIQLRDFFSRDRSLTLLCGLFLACIFSTLLFSGAPIKQQIWGVFGRNTGVATYIALLAVMFCTSLLQDAYLYRKIFLSLVYVAIPMLLYCFIQMAGKDPINWSSFETFATLGNINFLSAFLGMVAVSLSTLLMDSELRGTRRNLYLAMLASSLLVIWSTGSIQGILIFAAGMVLVIWIKLRVFKRRKMLRLTFGLSVLVTSVPVLLGIFNKGPLASILYQTSNLLRADYMHAGWQMTTDHPLFGVGMDTYGDWYRQARGEITTLRGSADRISNAAHNIFLDFSSNGGFPLLLSYLSLVIYASLCLVRSLRSVPMGKFDPVITGAGATWVAYQVQALVSINQVGVGIWGWIFNGLIIGYAKCQKSKEDAKNNFTNTSYLKLRNSLLPPKESFLAVTGLLLGFIISWFPIRADAAYFAASKTRSLEQIIPSTRHLGSAVWHSELALDAAIRIPADQQAREIALYILDENPRDFFAWKAIWLLPNSSNEERELALSKLRSLDPYNPEFKG